MAAIDDSLERYRNPREALSRGLEVREIVPERIFVNPDGTAAQPPRVVNPNVSAQGSPQAQAFRASQQAPAAAATAADIAGPVLTRAQRAARAVRGVGAAALPAVAGIALTRAADAAVGAPGDIAAPPPQPGVAQIPGIDAAPAGYADLYRAPPAAAPSFFRDTEVGRNVGNLVNATTGSGPIGAVRTLSEAMRAGSAAARLADIASMVGRSAVAANDGAAPVPGAAALRVGGAGGGRGFVNPPLVDPNAPAPVVDTGLQRSEARGGVSFPEGGVGEAAARELRALEIERQNSELRQQLDAFGPGARNPDGSGGYASLGSGYAQRLAQTNAETTGAALRFESRLASGKRADELLKQAQETEQTPGARADQAAKRQAELDIAGLRERGNLEERKVADATKRRGQDIELMSERERRDSALKVAQAAGDARVAAAEAKTLRPVVVDMGEEIVDTPMGPQKVKRPSLVIDSNTGKVLDIAGPAAGRAPTSIATDPRAIAIRDDRNLSDDQKRAKLKALGYQ